MDPSGNSAGGKTPPSSPNQTQLHWPGQTHVTANNELHIINEPSLPLPNAGGRRAPPSPPRPLEIEEPRQPPLGANQESHIIDEQIPPPHHAANGRGPQPWPSPQRQHELIEQGLKDTILQLQQYLLRVNHDSLTKKPSPWVPGERAYSQAWKNQIQQQELEDNILKYQHALRVHQESHTMKKPSSSSEDRRGGVVARSCANCNSTSTTQWRSDPTGQKSLCNACGIRLNNREEETRAASRLQSSNIVLPPETSSSAARNRVDLFDLENNFLGHYWELSSSNIHFPSSTIYFPPRTSSSAAPTSLSQEARNIVEFMEKNANPFVPENNFSRHSLGLQSSNLVSPPLEMSPPAAQPSSSSEDRRGGVVARSCANCNNTSTTRWRSDPTGQKSLCNACGIRLNNREEETRAASGLQSSNLVLPPETSSSGARNRVELMENNANPFDSENNFLGHYWELPSSNIHFPPRTSSSAAPTRFSQEARNIGEFMENNANPFVPENNFLGHSSGLQSSNISSGARIRRHLEAVRNRVEPMENNANPFVPENNFLGPSWGLQSWNIEPMPPEMPPPGAPGLANSFQLIENMLWEDPPAEPLRDPSEVASKMEEFSQRPIDRTLDNNPFVPENNFLRPSWGLQPLNIVPPPPEMPPLAAPSLANCSVQHVENISGLQSSPPLRDTPEEASETEEFWQRWINKSPDNSPVCKRAKMEEPPAVPLPDPSEVASNMEEFSRSLTDRTSDNNPFVSENNFLRPFWGLQPLNIVPPPPEMPPPAAPSLANSVQHVENISRLQPSPPLRDTPEEASETEELWQSWINKSPDNSPGA